MQEGLRQSISTGTKYYRGTLTELGTGNGTIFFETQVLLKISGILPERFQTPLISQ